MELVLKTSDTREGTGGSNPSLSAIKVNASHGDVPKLAEGAPLLRV